MSGYRINPADIFTPAESLTKTASRSMADRFTETATRASVAATGRLSSLLVPLIFSLLNSSDSG